MLSFQRRVRINPTVCGEAGIHSRRRSGRQAASGRVARRENQCKARGAAVEGQLRCRDLDGAPTEVASASPNLMPLKTVMALQRSTGK